MYVWLVWAQIPAEPVALDPPDRQEVAFSIAALPRRVCAFPGNALGQTRASASPALASSRNEIHYCVHTRLQP